MNIKNSFINYFNFERHFIIFNSFGNIAQKNVTHKFFLVRYSEFGFALTRQTLTHPILTNSYNHLLSKKKCET